MEFWKWPKDMCSCIIPMNSQIWTCETVNLFCLNFPRKLHQTPGTYPRPSTTCLFQEIPSYLYFGVPGVCSIFWYSVYVQFLNMNMQAVINLFDLNLWVVWSFFPKVHGSVVVKTDTLRWLLLYRWRLTLQRCCWWPRPRFFQNIPIWGNYWATTNPPVDHRKKWWFR